MLKSKKGFKPRNKRIGAGKKTHQWDSIRKQLISRFAQAGITTCELQYKGCWHDNALTFAHRKKRRFCDEKELWICVLACSQCHHKVEILRHDAMFEILSQAIEKRHRQP